MKPKLKTMKPKLKKLSADDEAAMIEVFKNDGDMSAKECATYARQLQRLTDNYKRVAAILADPTSIGAIRWAAMVNGGEIPRNQ